jgi:nucleoside-diphosphate-sugar epimerase
MEGVVSRHALVLGGRGGIGSAVVTALESAGWATTVVGRGDDWPASACVVVNAVGAGMSSDQRGDVAVLRDANVIVAERAGVFAASVGARLIHLGTPLQRTPLLALSDPYVTTKSEASARLSAMPTLDLIELWPHLVVGPPTSLPARIASTLASGRPFPLRTPRARRDLVHAADVARAVVLAASTTHGVDGPVEVGTGVGTELAEVATLVARVVGADVGWVAEPRDDEGWDGDLIADTGPAKATLGFCAQIGLEDAVTLTVRGHQP